MKKNAILLSLLIIIDLSICAQDTITNPAELGGIMCHFTSKNYNNTQYGPCSTMELAVGYNVNKETSIFGVAAVVCPRYEFDAYYDSIATLEDYAECFEYGRMYRLNIDGDSLIVVGEGMIHALDSNVIGYYDFGTYYNYLPYQLYHNILPIRATYFEHPITIFDTFYVGITDICRQHHNNNLHYNCMELGFIMNNDSSVNYDMALYGGGVNRRNEWHFEKKYDAIFLIFPLLDSLPMYASPLVSGGNGSAEAPMVTLDSFISVSPNPTTGTATVKSSFGIDEVELYDLGGAPLLRQRASGLTHTLNLQALPTGTYILKVHTPYGTTTKKMIKQ